MSKLFLDILDSDRIRIFEKLSTFNRTGVLSGGTAIALQIKHRRSYDFDVFIKREITTSLRFKAKKVFGRGIQIIKDETHQLDFLAQGNVKVTFVSHPYPPIYSLVKTESIYLFDLRDLASNKAFTIGRRGTWRDYVDLFWLIKENYVKLDSVINETEKRFGGEFSQKLFLQQLVYIKDILNFDIDYIDKKYSPEDVVEFFKKETTNYVASLVKDASS